MAARDDGFRMLVRREAARVQPIERLKVLLMQLLAKAPVGLQVNNHVVEPGTCFAMLVNLASKPSCRSGSARLTAPADRARGSSSRTRRPRP